MRVLGLLLFVISIAISACAPTKAAPTLVPATAPQATESPRSLPSATAGPAVSPTVVRPAATAAPTVALSGPTGEILGRVAASRGLAVERAVPSATIGRDELRAYLIRSAEQNNVKQDLEKSKALLVALELLDPSTDLYAVWLESLTEQVAGFYEFETQQMKLVTSGNLNNISIADEIVLAHEYTHALGDQHFNFRMLSERVKNRGEATAALQALTEGDATLSEVEYARKYKTPEQLSELFGRPTRIDASRLRSAPSVVQSSLLFPYVQGGAFVAGLFQSGGWAAVNNAYSHPPVSTEQILHPDRYQRGDLPQNVNLPNLAAALGSEWQAFDSDTVGELGWLLYLAGGGLTPRASGPTAGWGGDRYTIFRNSSGQLALASLTVWDAPGNARGFFTAVRELQKARKGTTMPVLGDREVSWVGKSASGYAAVDGFNVLLVITPDEATTKKMTARFPGLAL